MSKKNKKNKKKSSYKYYGDYSVSGGKKNKKNKKKLKAKTKDVKPSLSGKEGKKNAKIIKAPVKVSEKFLERRTRCNHADGTISVAEFKAMSPTATAYTPMLDRVVELFGEEHVRICARCYDVVIDRDQISADAVAEALTTLYAGVNVAQANIKLKDDEIKKLSKLKTGLEKFAPVVAILSKVEDTQAEGAPSGGNPNANPGAVYVQ